MPTAELARDEFVQEQIDRDMVGNLLNVDRKSFMGFIFFFININRVTGHAMANYNVTWPEHWK